MKLLATCLLALFAWSSVSNRVSFNELKAAQLKRPAKFRNAQSGDSGDLLPQMPGDRNGYLKRVVDKKRPKIYNPSIDELPPAQVGRFTESRKKLMKYLAARNSSAMEFHRNHVTYPLKNRTNSQAPPPPPPPYVPSTGFCGYANKTTRSLWLKLPDKVCTKQTCLWSPYINSGLRLQDLPSLKMVNLSAWIASNNQSTCMPRASDRLPSSKTIAVSIIFTVHNAPEMTVKCILDIFSTVLEIPDATEIVLVDDASDVDMSAVHGLLQKIKVLFGYRVSIIKSPKNIGFGASNNLALRAAIGEYALLLNSDILVNAGWLSALMYTMKTYPRAGMVGPMMLGVDGRVKESGGFVHQGGQPANFGRRMKPDKVPYLHARAVDYISAACLMVRRKLFLDLGLFDPQFEPAYYEDTDAAMVHLRAGFVTVLQPLAVVTHVEGASISSRAKDALMARNKDLFYKKHKEVLDNFCPAVDGSCPKVKNGFGELYSTVARDGPHVLILEKHLPRPDRDSGSVRLYEIVRIFMQLGYKVSVELMAMFPVEDVYKVSLLAEGVNVHSVGTLKSLVIKSASIKNSEMRCPWDIIFISKRPPFSYNIADVKALCPKTPIIYDTVDVHFIREERMADYIQLNETITAGNKAEELSFMRLSDVNLVVSDYEHAVLRRNEPSLKISVLSNIYPPPSQNDTMALTNRKGALFVGNLCHHPNRDALDFIFKRLCPIIRKHRYSELQIYLVLSNLDKCRYRRLSKYSRRYHVKVYTDITDADLLTLHNRMRMVIAPLRFGAGVKGKVNYALLHGIPVVATNIATEGMHMVPGESVMHAESDVEFILAMKKVAEDDKLWRRLQKGGWDVMDRYFTRDVAKKVLVRTLTQTLQLSLPAWGDGVSHPGINLRSCPNNGTMSSLPRACKGCWHCPLNEHFYLPADMTLV